jgi:hypothetical protein
LQLGHVGKRPISTRMIDQFHNGGPMIHRLHVEDDLVRAEQLRQLHKLAESDSANPAPCGGGEWVSSIPFTRQQSRQQLFHKRTLAPSLPLVETSDLAQPPTIRPHSIFHPNGIHLAAAPLRGDDLTHNPPPAR